MRHADAVSENSDRTRALSLTGLQQVVFMNKKLQPFVKEVQLIICSNAKRCRQTLGGILDIFPPTVDKDYSDVLYQAQQGQFLKVLRSLSDHVNNVFVLGHNPYIGDFTKQSKMGDRIDIFGTACAAGLVSAISSWAQCTAPSFELEAFIEPHD